MQCLFELRRHMLRVEMIKDCDRIEGLVVLNNFLLKSPGVARGEDGNRICTQGYQSVVKCSKGMARC